MTHVATHCGGVGDELGTIPVTIHDHKRLNYAVALKRWPDESDKSWEKRQARLQKLKEQVYKLARMTSEDEFYYHEPSYVHPEP